MTGYPSCLYRNVSERDMDLLFMEAFATDPDFFNLFIEKIDRTGLPCTVVSAERSKVDQGLGESDITVKYQCGENIYALLIEDKIDAIAMPEQHGRYIKRGEKGIAAGEYSKFDVFIVCPNRYREGNEEAQKYEHFVSYEECQEFFTGKDDAHSRLWYQQISQAIETMKAEYKVDINEVAVDSFGKYLDYQRAYYPRLKSLNQSGKKDVNGWWPFFAGTSKDIYIIHKTNFNCVDLTINGAADKIAELQVIEKWLHDGGHTDITLVKTGKSAAFRIMTPEIKMAQPFETWKMGDLNRCFEAIQELADLAMMFGVIHAVVFRKG